MTESDTIYSEFPEIAFVTSYASEKTIFNRDSIGFDNKKHVHFKIDKKFKDFRGKCKDVVDNIFNDNDSKLEVNIKHCDHLKETKDTSLRLLRTETHPYKRHIHINDNANYSQVVTSGTSVNITQTGGTKISEECFLAGYESIQQSKPKMTASKATQTEWNNDSLIVRDLVMNKFSDALEIHRIKSLQRKEKRLQMQKFSFEGYQNEEIKTEQVCTKSEYSDKTDYTRTTNSSNGGNEMLIRSEKCKAEDIAQESLINRSKTEGNEHNILQQKRQQKTEVSDAYPSASPKFKSTPINFSCNEVTDKLKHSSSIDDSEVSLLLSRSTPITPIPNSMMEYHSNSSGEDTAIQQKYNYNNKKDELLKSYFVNYETMVQSTKAIQFCKNSKESILASQHVELERVLLIAKLRSEAAATELASLYYNSMCNYTSNKSGSVFVKNIALPGKQSNKSKKNATWYVCIVSCGTEIFGTAATQPNANGDISFDEEFEIKTRSHNFEIAITLYAMTISNYKKKFPRFNLSRARNNHTDGFQIRKTSFLPYSKIVIYLKDLKRTEFQLPLNSKQLNLLGILNVSLRAEPKLSGGFKSFLDVGKTYGGGGLFWNKLWCCLEGKTIKMYKYPQDEEEDRHIEALELDRCSSPAVKVTERRRTLLIGFVDKSEKDPTTNKIFLSADLGHETDIWLKSINSVFTSLESWNCLKC